MEGCAMLHPQREATGGTSDLRHFEVRGTGWMPLVPGSHFGYDADKTACREESLERKERRSGGGFLGRGGSFDQIQDMIFRHLLPGRDQRADPGARFRPAGLPKLMVALGVWGAWFRSPLRIFALSASARTSKMETRRNSQLP